MTFGGVLVALVVDDSPGAAGPLSQLCGVVADARHGDRLGPAFAGRARPGAKPKRERPDLSAPRAAERCPV